MATLNQIKLPTDAERAARTFLNVVADLFGNAGAFHVGLPEGAGLAVEGPAIVVLFAGGEFVLRAEKVAR